MPAADTPLQRAYHVRVSCNKSRRSIFHVSRTACRVPCKRTLTLGTVLTRVLKIIF